MALLDAFPTKTPLGFRRSRFAPRQPIAKRIVLNDSDEQVFSALKRHKKLPVPHLFAFTKKKSYLEFQHRLTLLYNGTVDGTYYLDRPDEQCNNMNARYQHFVYSLKDDKGGGWFVHQLMGGCIRASIELGLPEGVTFAHRDTVLDGKPLKVQIARGSYIIPDDFFGLRYPDGRRAFACEDDRATESIKGDLDANYIGEKIENYLTVLEDMTYQEKWGVKGLMVLIATVTEERKRALLNLLGGRRYADRFLFKVFPDFGKHWKVPGVYEDVFEWESVRGRFDIRG